jgi:hypothetical protein
MKAMSLRKTAVLGALASTCLLARAHDHMPARRHQQ